MRDAGRLRGVALLLAMAVIAVLLVVAPSAAALREVRVGVWIYPPQVSFDADGRPTGIFVDIVEAVGDQNGWEITYVEGTWEDTLARLRSGEIDLGLGVGQVALRRAEFDLTDEPVVSDWGQIFTRERDRIETVLDLEGKTVVGWKSDRTYRSLQHLAREFGVEADYLATNSIAENFAMVVDGRADAVVELRIPGRAHARDCGLVTSPVTFSPITFGFATQKGRNGDLIRELDAFVAEGKDVSGSPYDQIMEKWLGTQPSVEWRVPTYVIAIILAVATVAILFVAVSLLLRHQVSRRTSALRAQRDLVTRLMETSPVGIVLVGPDGRVSLANARADELFGVPSEYAARPPAGKAPVATAGADAEDQSFAPLAQPATHVIESREPVHGVGISATAAGRLLRLEVNGAPVFSESGELTGALLAIMDVSDRERALEELEGYRAHLEDIVGQRTAALEAANEQLESFSYSVSHDLRAPLRALDGFSYALLEDAGDRLDDASRAYLVRIRRASQHMAELIDALLKLSRAARSEFELSDVSITEIAERAAAELSASEPEHDVEWDIRPGLCARADAALAGVVMENLLSNAWKFSMGRDPAHITVGETETDDGPVFFVRDDGVGFDPAHADKLFRPFERLHTRKEFPGTGIGLATVRRVLTRHGGLCWATGSKDEGAVVYFTFGGGCAGGRSG